MAYIEKSGLVSSPVNIGRGENFAAGLVPQKSKPIVFKVDPNQIIQDAAASQVLKQWEKEIREKAQEELKKQYGGGMNIQGRNATEEEKNKLKNRPVFSNGKIDFNYALTATTANDPNGNRKFHLLVTVVPALKAQSGDKIELESLEKEKEFLITTDVIGGIVNIIPFNPASVDTASNPSQDASDPASQSLSPRIEKTGKTTSYTPSWVLLSACPPSAIKP